MGHDVPATHVLAVDPGRSKCGLALLRADGEVLYHAVIPTSEVGAAVADLLARCPDAAVVMGDRTSARGVAEALWERLQQRAVMVDEHHSSEEGRRRYFREHPPRGWRRLLPLGLQTPPCPYDDYVAVILAERYLASKR